MAWVTPIIHSVGDILTASDWNISSNDLSFLGGAVGGAVASSETTASTSYTNLATVGPTATVTTGANAIVIVTANIANAAGGDGAAMGYAITGATTIAASDQNSLQYGASLGGAYPQASAVFPQGGLTPGSNIFTAKYKAITGGTGVFGNRCIMVIPLL